MSNYYYYLNEDKSKLYIPKELALMLITFFEEWVNDGDGFHRTPVNEIQGDVLDQVEVEMINDDIISTVENEFLEQNKSGLNLLLNILSDADNEQPYIDATDFEKVQQLLMISNTVYTQLSKDKADDFTIGSSQANDGGGSIDLSEVQDNPREMLRILVMALIEELVEVWN